MGTSFELAIFFLAFYVGQSNEQQNYVLEKLFLPQYRAFKDVYLKVFTPLTKNKEHLQKARELKILQPRINDDVPFPCSLNNSRSKTPPTSVHSLRPGDIDVIAAIGDSLTAGNGLLATNLLHVVLENRGISFSTGGQETWRQYVTIANILQEFNPNLLGYSVADGFGHHFQATQLNVAEGGAISRDMPYMSKVLVKRMQSNPKIDINRHWKLITFMIGSNDFCGEMCYRKNPEIILEEHRRELLQVLRTLRDNLPRTIVNLIVQPNLKILANSTASNRPPLCYYILNIECPCLFGLQFQHSQAKYEEIMLRWQQIEIDVANDPEFDRDDFTVVIQPFTMDYELAKTKEGLSDYSVFSQDCFHLSQKEGARAALSLWNNFLEPIGQKTAHGTELFNFKCPSRDRPFIFTKRNSFN